MTTTKQDMQKQVERLEAELVTLKGQITAMPSEDVGGWRPRYGEEYFFIDLIEFPCVASTIWDNDEIDEARYELGICYRTPEEAENVLRKQKAMAKLKRLNKGFVPDWNNTTQDKFYIYFDHYNRRVDVTETGWTEQCGVVYFASNQDTRDAIKAMGDQINDLLL